MIVKNDCADRQETLQDIGYKLAVRSYALPMIMTRTEDEWDQMRERNPDLPQELRARRGKRPVNNSAAEAVRDLWES